MPANGLGQLDIKSTLISWVLTFAQGSVSQVWWNQSLLIARTSQPRNPPRSKKIEASVISRGCRRGGPTHPSQVSPFKHLILETPLWSYSYSMSSNAKSPPEGLKASKCKKGKSGVRPPIPYIPPTNLIKKWEGEQIKVKMPDGTNFSMAAFTSGTNED
jgi:hypothetical protein